MPDGTYTLAPPILQEVLSGLGRLQKTLPAKLFYDTEGCRLFGEITRLPEYYPTRTEHALLGRMSEILPKLRGCALVEFGASDESKAVMLLDQILASTYVPIDVAASALEDMVYRLALSRPVLAVHPVVADFLKPFSMPSVTTALPKFGFFPGSTIGNFDLETARSFLLRVHDVLGRNARFLVGVDLLKDPAILLPAYNDEKGITAAFNLNILSHLNRELDAGFDLTAFEHRAVWNDLSSRIEMHLVSRWPQSINVANTTIHFAAGESIHTENSYKYTVQGFMTMASMAGWSSESVLVDDEKLFSLHLLAAT